MLNIIQEYGNKYDQFTRKITTTQDEFPELVNLV